MISVRELVYRYPGVEGSFQLGPLSMELPEGKLAFWVGHNGSGKTTLARLLCGELQPHSGTVAGIGGPRMHHRQSVAENLFPDLRVGDHLRLLSQPKSVRIADLRERFPELEEMAGKYPDELSGGQLQLTAFATIVLAKHGLYIFDEVLNHLDPQLAIRIMSWIRERIVSEAGASCVVVTHDLTWVRRHAEVVHVFAQGRVIATLSQDDIASDPDRLLRLVAGAGKVQR